MSVDAVAGLELLATTIVDKHMATVLPNYVLVRRSQRLKSVFTCITGVNTLSVVCFVPQTFIPISNNMSSLPYQPLTSSGPGAYFIDIVILS